MEIKTGLKYTESHEWIKVEDSIAIVGITDYAQDALGDIVFVEVPEVERKVSKGAEVVNIESVKVAEAVYAPVSGTICEINEQLEDEPELLNEAPYDTFIYSIEMTDPSELNGFMDAAEYEEFINNSKE
ncbi:MAG: glycine cleavage system protein H [Spirochaeta sp. LUC14_002_19_P3]|nr:MAG: glycine cleavage system protein H [Spirochaeta sp. LUC14_002_19_P3]